MCLYSQSNIDSLKMGDTTKTHKVVKQIDILDVYLNLFNRRSTTIDTNKKEKEFLSIIPAAGYAMSTGLTGVIATNISFYLDSNRSKLSSIAASAYYTQFNQYWLLVNTYITSEELKVNFIGDWRIYKYPTNTFGLGGSNSISDALQIDFAYLKFYEVASREILPNFFVGIGYHLDYHWNIKSDSTSTPDNTYEQIMKYGFPKHSSTSGLSANFMFDNRRNPINPENGLSASIQLRQNLTLIGSNYNSQTLLIDIRKYLRLPFDEENILAFWSYNSFTVSGKLPYLDLPSTGWDAYNNTGRGYVQGRFRGNNFVYLESEYRFKITNNGLLGGVVFGNAESVSYPSNNFNNVLFGEGFGIRIKINSTSKSNLALDYGFGQGNSHGLFLNLGEVF